MEKWILPRPKKQSNGLSLTLASFGPVFRIPIKMKTARMGCLHFWSECNCRVYNSNIFDFCPHPQGMRPETKGFSHGLKSVPRTLFAPVCALVPAFRIPQPIQIRKPTRLVDFLIWSPFRAFIRTSERSMSSMSKGSVRSFLALPRLITNFTRSS